MLASRLARSTQYHTRILFAANKVVMCASYVLYVFTYIHTALKPVYVCAYS